MKNVLKVFSFFIGTCLSISVFANHPTIDVYGTNKKIAAKLVHQFGPEIEAYAQCHAAEYRLKPECQPENQAKTKQKIIEKIKNSGDFAYAEISTITYPDLKEFITIDVVEKKDKKRIAYLAQFNAKNFNAKIKKSKELDILINEWLSYEKVGEELFYKKEIRFTQNCPVYHCTLGFEHPDLNPYQALFDNGVSKNKNKLIETLRTDPDAQRRGVAAFLLAHIKNGEELINILTPCMQDPSEDVRNNVMRVLGMTLLLVKPTNFNIDPIIQALDSPVLTDRNKALCMIVSLGNQPKYANYIAKHAGDSVMASLKMTQPNLHSTAHVVLRIISGKDYGEYEYDAWQNWLSEQAKV